MLEPTVSGRPIRQSATILTLIQSAKTGVASNAPILDLQVLKTGVQQTETIKGDYLSAITVE